MTQRSQRLGRTMASGRRRRSSPGRLLKDSNRPVGDAVRRAPATRRDRLDSLIGQPPQRVLPNGWLTIARSDDILPGHEDHSRLRGNGAAGLARLEAPETALTGEAARICRDASLLPTRGSGTAHRSAAAGSGPDPEGDGAKHRPSNPPSASIGCGLARRKESVASLCRVRRSGGSSLKMFWPGAEACAAASAPARSSCIRWGT